MILHILLRMPLWQTSLPRASITAPSHLQDNEQTYATSQMLLHILSILLWQKLELSFDKRFMGLP